MPGVGGTLVQTTPPGYFDPHNWSDAGLSPNSQWDPQDNGLLAASGDPMAFTGTILLTAGTVMVAKLPIRIPTVITNLLFMLTTAGSGASTGSFAGLFDDVTGNQIRITADIAAQLTGATGTITCALTSPVTVQPPFVWACLVENLATTQPTLARLAAPIGNFGPLGASGLRFATNVTGQTALPNPLVISSNVTTVNGLLVGAT